MKKSKVLQMILYIAAGLTVLYFLLSLLVISFPQIFYSLNGVHSELKMEILSKVMLTLRAAIPLCMGGLCIYGAAGETVTKQKAGIMLAAATAYFMLGGIAGVVLNILTTNLTAKLYSADALAAVSCITPALSLLSVLTSTAWALTVAVTAIFYYETNKSE